MLPAGLLLIERNPTAGHPYLFSVRIKLDEGLQNALDSGNDESGPSFLSDSIATGTWYGAYCTVAALPREPRQHFYLHGMTTWRELLSTLYEHHPTGTYRDLDSKEDVFPDEDWSFYEVQVSLFAGTKVVQMLEK